ncbi:MAG TPA: NAD(P)-dependent oxidoreductase [Streptosporangiaceae bacterium]|nr:NAD(P)-dependent oxidoreductase [Streptosporangiaceae bacterium]
MSGQQTVAVLGAGGTMGFPMAANLARAGFSVRAWNRSRDKAEPLSKDGVRVCGTPAEAAEGASVILTMLADTDAVLAAVDGPDGAFAAAKEAGPAPGAATGPADGIIWLQMSTIGEAGTERCADLAGRQDLTLIDAPVLGTRQPADEGKLVVLASGPVMAKNRVQPIFDAIGQKTIWVGEAGAGTRLKLVTNNWVLTVTEGTAETIALAQGLGLDPRLFLDAVAGGTLDLPYLRIKSEAILNADYTPSFRLKLAAKDAALVAEAAERHSVDVPLTRLLRDRLAEGAREHGDKDMAATYLSSAPRRDDQ